MNLQKLGRLGTQLMKIAVTRPKRLSHIMGTALAATDEVSNWDRDLLRFRRATTNDLLPQGGSPYLIELALFPKTHASISSLEFVCLVLLLKKVSARKVFEFGTYKGVSITQLALNLPEGSQIFTLDLPATPVKTRFAIADPEDAVIAAESDKGELVPKDIRPRITFLEKDSAAFDETPYLNSMDFVFVDGAHNYDYVRNDSQKGWRMLRSGGIIAWHDCRPQDPDVVRYLLQSSFDPTLIVGTTVAYAVKP